ncbi:MAG: hypothetical protein JWQ90_847 [Hydrocarboniphaga sp.]|uniref:hypothetical protein n=1 Tax=Hydrocarboniphaga sp. TaxID=2033016 RepID=UPI00261CAEB7|nr:hypothetical protein [Hydrocarboniphaga sp.]MDB5968397.1 hypothetical protein [Hydrocarboniphaga sp.]
MIPKILELVPWTATMPALPQAILIALSCLMFVLASWFVVAETRRRGDWVPVFAFLGGGLAVGYEPLGDILVSVLYPVHGQIGWIDLFGRQVPLFIGVLYFWYMSVPALYFLKKVEQGLNRATLWKLYAFTLAIAIGIEIFGVNLGAWVYYGPQPFVVLGVPLSCPMTYSAFLVTISIGLHAMATHLDRRHHWLILFGLPLCMGGGHCAAALPIAAAMFTTDNPLWIHLGALASSAFSLLLVYTASLIYCNDGKAAARRHANRAWNGTAPAL